MSRRGRSPRPVPGLLGSDVKLRWNNATASMISISRDTSRNIKHWREGQVALQWCAHGWMVEAGKQFRHVNGHLHLPVLRATREREVTETVGSWWASPD